MMAEPIRVVTEDVIQIARNMLTGQFGISYPSKKLPPLSREQVLDFVGEFYDQVAKTGSDVNAVFVVFIGSRNGRHFSSPFLFFDDSVDIKSYELLQFASYFLGQGVVYYLTNVFPHFVAPCFSCPHREYCSSMSVIHLFYGMASAIFAPIVNMEGDVDAARDHAISYLRYLRDRLNFLLELLENPADVEAEIRERSEGADQR